MHKQLIGLAAVVVAVGAVGCSSSTTYSCNYAANGACFEWTTEGELSASEISAFEASCSGAAATFDSNSGCPSTNRVGSCVLSDVSGAPYTQVFYSPLFDATAGQAQCTGAGGSWTAG